ncbi:plastid lipid-associated protein/fibrillin conserved domain-containing protein [Ostreococcus tauri]|uniref:Plastid lipid-associated protein/fibrillin conserved domain-containing protein n=1 Tax=Ostreococcus tauri TaxID=70448 RepID=A0A1Y5I7S0_OSTTA|nr:plastid lipid-associated protein/fibrillin conserved domain-containing protein [Ostreococcus tauri]
MSARSMGARAGDAEKGDVERAVDALAASTSKTSENNAAAHGRWRLRYTTEKETLFLLKLKESTTEAFQTLDVKGKTLKNEVVFNDGDAVFTVDAKIEAVSDTRMDFSFTGASLAFRGGLTIPIPPFGSGWFENVYVDDTTRVSRDSRGDTLVCDRVS